MNPDNRISAESLEHLRSSRIFQDITSFIFLDDSHLQPVDVIFIPGSASPEIPVEAARLHNEGLARYILPSGRGPKRLGGRFVSAGRDADRYPGPYKTEWEFMADVLRKNGVPPEMILKEDNAVYTKQNAYFSRSILDNLNLSITSAIICCKSFHSRRSLIAYQLAFPHVRFQIRSLPAYHSGQLITREDWMDSPAGIHAVFGEIRRIGEQFGDDMIDLLID